MAAGNEWINGYLEAILDAGAKLRGEGLSLPRLQPAPTLASEESSAAYNPTRYFVEEVVRSDDQALHKTWTKVVAMKNSQERNNRLENLCWRIWNVSRQKKQLAGPTPSDPLPRLKPPGPPSSFASKPPDQSPLPIEAPARARQPQPLPIDRSHAKPSTPAARAIASPSRQPRSTSSRSRRGSTSRGCSRTATAEEVAGASSSSTPRGSSLAAPVERILATLNSTAAAGMVVGTRDDGSISMEGTRESAHGALAVGAEIYELTPDLVVVEVRRKAGGAAEYEEFFRSRLKPRMCDLMCDTAPCLDADDL